MFNVLHLELEIWIVGKDIQIIIVIVIIIVIIHDSM